MTKSAQALKAAQERLADIRATRAAKELAAKEYEEMAAQERQEAEELEKDEQEAQELVESYEAIKAAMVEAIRTLQAKSQAHITDSDIAEALVHVFGEVEEEQEPDDTELVA
jgi:DNA polymerase III delta prime subunit